MQELKFKIKGTETAQVEIVPVSDGVEIIVHYGSEAPVPSQERKPFKPRNYAQDKTPEEIIEGIKIAARNEYKKEGADKEELTKFVKFYERKIQEDGWKGNFDFDKLYGSWLSKKR